jgi:hypothetical protein
MKPVINTKRQTKASIASDFAFHGNLFTVITLSGRDIHLKYSPLMTAQTGRLGSVKLVNISTAIGVKNPQQIKRVSQWHTRCFTPWQIRSFGG